MNAKTWLIALAALVLGAAGAVAITQGGQEDAGVAATPTQTTETEPPRDQQKQEKQNKNKEKTADGDEPAEQEVEVTVDAYVEAMEQGATDALCSIQTEALAAEACAQAAEGFDWTAWASQVNLDDLQVDVTGGTTSPWTASGRVSGGSMASRPRAGAAAAWSSRLRSAFSCPRDSPFNKRYVRPLELAWTCPTSVRRYLPVTPTAVT
jgi:hypothetical protein